MHQGTDTSLTAHLAKQEELPLYVGGGRIISDLLHITLYPSEIKNTFLKITDMLNTKSGLFAIIEREGRNSTDFYANCYNNVRMAICATWYNMYSKELEERVVAVMKTHAIKSQLQMNIGSSNASQSPILDLSNPVKKGEKYLKYE